MKTLSLIVIMVVVAFVLVACSGKKDDTANLKPVDTRSVGKLTIMLLSTTGELKQGQNDFVVRFKDDKGQLVEVSDVHLGSSMTMPSMAPMSGGSEIRPTGQTGTYRVKSNFGMSGAWHFTISWNGPYGQGSTAFNSNVR
jgi:YtkA-like